MQIALFINIYFFSFKHESFSDKDSMAEIEVGNEVVTESEGDVGANEESFDSTVSLSVSYCHFKR